MDHSEFDLLLRRVTRQTTRRGALATLVGGALLARGAAPGEATKEAQRRKARRKRQKSAFPKLRPFWIWVENPGAAPVTVAHGDGQSCCKVLNRSVIVPPRSRMAFASGYNEDLFTRGFVWINERFWVSFDNFPGQRPDVTAAVDGQPVGNRFCCLPPPAGTTVVSDKAMSVGHLSSFNLASHSFWVTRERDTNYIVVSVILPATL